MSRSAPVYFDYISPFAYVAAEILPDWLSQRGLAPDWRPISLLALSNFSERLPYSRSKRAYVALDAQRTAAMHGVAIQPPRPFPVDSGAALRLARVAAAHAAFESLHRGLFRAAWRDRRDLGSDEVLRDCIAQAGGEPDAWLAASRGPGPASEVEALTAEAEGLGVFGVPTLVLDGELFWGVDCLPALAWRLEGGGGAR